MGAWWCMQGDERSDLVVCPGNQRDKATLHPIIKENIAIGSRIITDGWHTRRWVRKVMSGIR